MSLENEEEREKKDEEKERLENLIYFFRNIDNQ
jgi:hypothetical protein